MLGQSDAVAVEKALHTRQVNKAVEHLMGMVTGMVADASLHDLEIKLLSTWVADNPAVVQSWPGFVVARKLREVLEDGVITSAERAHLLKVLTELASSDFSLTGSATPEVAALPIRIVPHWHQDLGKPERHAGLQYRAKTGQAGHARQQHL